MKNLNCDEKMLGWLGRLERYSSSRQWNKAESDPDWFVRLEAYKKTKNFKKALNDPDYRVRKVIESLFVAGAK